MLSFSEIRRRSILPLADALGMAWMIDGLVEMSIYGLVVGLVYKPRSVAAK